MKVAENLSKRRVNLTGDYTVTKNRSIFLTLKNFFDRLGLVSPVIGRVDLRIQIEIRSFTGYD